MKKIMLMLLLAAPVFAGDIYIVSPLEKETVSGVFTLQVQEPWGNPPSIRAWATLDVNNGPDVVVWQGSLTAKDGYAVQIDASKFRPGKYEIEVEYVFQGQKYDESVDVYVR